MGSECLVGTEFRFGRDSGEGILELDGGDGSTTVSMYLMPHRRFKSGQHGKFC